MTLDIINKTILLIAPKYFNYEKEIQNELEKRGADVYFIDDRIKNTTINKALFRLKIKTHLSQTRVFNYFKTHLGKVKNKRIDYLIAIIPEGFSRDIIKYYKAELKDTIFILYMWDSIDNRPYIIETLNLYDKAYTFDKSNSEKYGLKFRPLFYTEDYRKLGESRPDFNGAKYDLSFIGTAHSDRYSVIKKLISTSAKKLSTFLFFYLQHPVLIGYYYMNDPMFRNIKIKDISFKGLLKHQVLLVIKDSACIIDINHPKQTGLTIRTLEVLGAKRKLITTNIDILSYDFYHPDNIFLINRENPVFDDSFLAKPYKELGESIYNKYSISTWIDEILS
jgi:hypothetical protein